MKVVYLNVTSWAGRLSYAAHWYGRLTTWVDNDCISEDVTYRLNKEDADRLNDSHPYSHAKEGHDSSRFFSYSSVIEYAVQQWKTHWPDAEVLLLGESSVLDPMEVLAGPIEIYVRGDEIVKQCYATGYYDADELTAEHKELRAQWRELIE